MSAESPPDLSIVIPVYGGGKTITRIVQDIVCQVNTESQIEIILVDDDSPDNAWQILRDLHGRYPRLVRAVRLMRNFGQHNAIMCGLRHARGRYIITMDDDGQHPPKEIERLVRCLEETGADVVYGVPRRREHANWRNFGSAIVTAFYKTIFRTNVTPSAFRILRRETVASILPYDLNYTYLDGLLAWSTNRIASVEVEHLPRSEGKSGYSLAKLIHLALNVFTSFSYLPLQVVTFLGFVVALFGLGMGAYYVFRYLTGAITVPGYASIIVAVLVLGGLQMLALGIIGEYLGRVHLNINRKPQYVVRDMIEIEDDSTESRDDAAI